MLTAKSKLISIFSHKLSLHAATSLSTGRIVFLIVAFKEYEFNAVVEIMLNEYHVTPPKDRKCPP